MTSSYFIEPSFDVLVSLSTKFQELNIEDQSWLKGEDISRHLYLIERYNEILKGFIMARQSPETFAGFR